VAASPLSEGLAERRDGHGLSDDSCRNGSCFPCRDRHGLRNRRAAAARALAARDVHRRGCPLRSTLGGECCIVEASIPVALAHYDASMKHTVEGVRESNQRISPQLGHPLGRKHARMIYGVFASKADDGNFGIRSIEHALQDIEAVRSHDELRGCRGCSAVGERDTRRAGVRSLGATGRKPRSAYTPVLTSLDAPPLS
jgi:hypothetical protein